MMQAAEGQILDCSKNYTIGKVIGRGAFATVHLVEDANKNIVVIKRVNLELSGNKLGRRLAELAKAEVDNLMRFRDHPNIVYMYSSFIEKNELSLVLAYCSGGDLHAAIRNRTEPFPEQLVHLLFLQIALALQFIHKQNPQVLHRDIKAKNIFLSAPIDTPFWVAKLGDFGIARVLEQGEEGGMTQCGTPTHMPPESLKRELFTAKGDVFSLGVTLHHFAALELPFGDMNMVPMEMQARIAFHNPSRIPEKHGFSAALSNLIAGMLVKDPKGRSSLDDVLMHEWVIGAPNMSKLVNSAVVNARQELQTLDSDNLDILRRMKEGFAALHGQNAETCKAISGLRNSSVESRATVATLVETVNKVMDDNARLSREIQELKSELVNFKRQASTSTGQHGSFSTYAFDSPNTEITPRRRDVRWQEWLKNSNSSHRVIALLPLRNKSGSVSSIIAVQEEGTITAIPSLTDSGMSIWSCKIRLPKQEPGASSKIRGAALGCISLSDDRNPHYAIFLSSKAAGCRGIHYVHIAADTTQGSLDFRVTLASPEQDRFPDRKYYGLATHSFTTPKSATVPRGGVAASLNSAKRYDLVVFCGHGRQEAGISVYALTGSSANTLVGQVDGANFSCSLAARPLSSERDNFVLLAAASDSLPQVRLLSVELLTGIGAGIQIGRCSPLQTIPVVESVYGMSFDQSSNIYLSCSNNVKYFALRDIDSEGTVIPPNDLNGVEESISNPRRSWQPIYSFETPLGRVILALDDTYAQPILVGQLNGNVSGTSLQRSMPISPIF